MPIPVEEMPLYKEGLQEGLMKGKLEGLQEGLLKGQKISLLEDIQLKFGIVPNDIEEKVLGISDINILREYKKALFSSQTIQEFIEKIK